MPDSRFRFFILVVLLFSPVTALPASVLSENEVTIKAVHLALLGDSDELTSLARTRRAWEDSARNRDMPFRPLSDNLTVLSETTLLILPRAKEVYSSLSGTTRDRETKSITELIRISEPRDRFQSARNNRLYEQRRKVFNSVTQAAFSLLQLNVIGLIQPPLDLATWAVEGKPYLSPEKRRELAAARQVVEELADDSVPRNAKHVIEKWPAKRLSSAKLQARENARLSEKTNRPAAAEWWWRRELLLEGQDAPIRERHLNLLNDIALENENRQRSNSIRISTSDNYSTDTERELLRQVLLREAGSAEELSTVSIPEYFQTEMQISEAAIHLRENRFASFRSVRDGVEDTDSGVWKARWNVYELTPEFYPVHAMKRARRSVRSDHLYYLFRGRSPQQTRRSLTSEQARKRSSYLIRRLRGVFILDTISRAITLPLLPKGTFPRDAWLDTLAHTPDDFLKYRSGEQFQNGVLKALNREKQFEEGAWMAIELGKNDRAASLTEKWVKQEIRRSTNALLPDTRIEQLRDLLEQFRGTAQESVIQNALMRQEVLRDQIINIDRRTLKRNPGIWNNEGLGLYPEYFDKHSRNGDLEKEGIWLLENDRVAWKNRRNRDWIVQDVQPGGVADALRKYFPRRRAETLKLVLDQPREQKRIPLAIEGAAYPGFSVFPGLVPLQPDPDVRRLYE